MASKTVKKGQVSKRVLNFKQNYPEVFKAYERLGNAVNDAGPLDHKARELVRLAIAIGARHEGAVHSRTPRALEAGISAEEVRHTVLLSVASVAGLKGKTWVFCRRMGDLPRRSWEGIYSKRLFKLVTTHNLPL